VAAIAKIGRDAQTRWAKLSYPRLTVGAKIAEPGRDSMASKESYMRREHFRSLWDQRVIGQWVAFAWLLHSVCAAIKSEYFDAKLQEQVRGVNLSLPGSWWLVVTLAIVGAWIFEASFKIQRKNLAKQAELNSAIEDLTAESTPKLKLSFHSDIDGVDLVPVKIYEPLSGHTKILVKNTYGTYLRVRVNTTTNKTVVGCNAYLTRVQKEATVTKAGSEINLRGRIDLTEEKPFDVHPGDGFFPLCFLSCNADSNKLDLPGGRFVLDNALKELGTYKFTIAAVGGSLQDTITIAVVWSGKWSEIKAFEVAPDA